jgi:hypothetical protein
MLLSQFRARTILQQIASWPPDLEASGQVNIALPSSETKCDGARKYGDRSYQKQGEYAGLAILKLGLRGVATRIRKRYCRSYRAVTFSGAAR